MERLGYIVLTDVLTLSVYVTVLCVPVLVVIVVLFRRQKAYGAEARAPFTEQLLRPPGESLRLRMEELDERFMEHATALLFIPSLCIALGFGSKFSAQPWLGGILAAGSGLYVTLQARKVLKLQRTRWAHRLGFEGERYVGETLNHLMADGYMVFHDIPFPNYNIDHVIVGPDGIYAVETKARRKPRNSPSNSKARVEVDGDRLIFPHTTDTAAIPQAARNAQSLADWLTRATGEPTSVEPLVVLVGWYVVRKPCARVRVLNEKEVRHAFPKRKAASFSPERLQRIVHQLSERCRLPQCDITSQATGGSPARTSFPVNGRD